MCHTDLSLKIQRILSLIVMIVIIKQLMTQHILVKINLRIGIAMLIMQMRSFHHIIVLYNLIHQLSYLS